MKYFLLDLVPEFFRDKWPMKRFYWQEEQIERAKKRAKEISETLNWK
jgi:hypothetical protein